MESTVSQLEAILLCFLCIVHGSLSAEPETTTDQWQPVYKTNSTKEWKAPTVQDAKWRDPSYVPNRREHVVTVYPSAPFPIGGVPSSASPFPIGNAKITNLHQFPPTHYAHALNRQDSFGAADSSFYSAYAPAAPIYGPSAHYSPHHHHHHSGYPPPPPPPPPPFPSSDQQVNIELAFDKLVLRCSVEDPLEHLVWTRYPCPNEYFYGQGIAVAEGSVVNNPDLYDVRIVGEGGHTGSELLMKAPLDPASSGLYVCEAWPHYQKDPVGDYSGPGPYGPPKPVYPAFSDVFIIGGSELLEECYKHPPHFHKKPHHLKKHYDEEFIEDDEHPPIKVTGPKKSKHVDAIRKPRNITRFENSPTSNKDFFSATSFTTNEDDSPRYNLRFENVTLQNASARDLFRSASAFSHLFRKDNGFQFMRNLSYEVRDDNTTQRPSPFSIFKSNGFNNLNFKRNTTFQLFKKDGLFGSSPFLANNKTVDTKPKLAGLDDPETKPGLSSSLFRKPAGDDKFKFGGVTQDSSLDDPETKPGLSASLFRKPAGNDKFRFGGDTQDSSSVFSTKFMKKKDDINNINPSQPVRNSESLLSDATIYTSLDDRVLENQSVNNGSKSEKVPEIKFEYNGNDNESPWIVSDSSFAVPQMSNNSIQIDSSSGRKSKILEI